MTISDLKAQVEKKNSVSYEDFTILISILEKLEHDLKTRGQGWKVS